MLTNDGHVRTRRRREAADAEQMRAMQQRHSPPDNEVPGIVAFQAVLGRTPDLVIALVSIAVYSSGLSFELPIRLRRDDDETGRIGDELLRRAATRHGGHGAVVRRRLPRWTQGDQRRRGSLPAPRPAERAANSVAEPRRRRWSQLPPELLAQSAARPGRPDGGLCVAVPRNRGDPNCDPGGAPGGRTGRGHRALAMGGSGRGCPAAAAAGSRPAAGQLVRRPLALSAAAR